MQKIVSMSHLKYKITSEYTVHTVEIAIDLVLVRMLQSVSHQVVVTLRYEIQIATTEGLL